MTPRNPSPSEDEDVSTDTVEQWLEKLAPHGLQTKWTSPWLLTPFRHRNVPALGTEESNPTVRICRYAVCDNYDGSGELARSPLYYRHGQYWWALHNDITYAWHTNAAVLQHLMLRALLGDKNYDTIWRDDLTSRPPLKGESQYG